jgi:hypothetical protein
MSARIWALALACACGVGACSPAGALCAKKQECDDERQDDDERVCRTAYDVGIATLRENDEAECDALADRQQEYDACRAGLSCQDFVEPDLNGLCEDERERYLDALDEAAGECASTD